MSKSAHFAREFGLITLGCIVTGIVIGAADGAAMSLSLSRRTDVQQLGVSTTQALSFWAIGAGAVGGIVAIGVGLPLYYLVFRRRLSRSEFVWIAGASFLGGVAFCAILGGSIMEWTWLATPCFTVLASVLVRLRQLRETT
jgi:hypothetical protein